jgi:hypothetical protein
MQFRHHSPPKHSSFEPISTLNIHIEAPMSIDAHRIAQAG